MNLKKKIGKNYLCMLLCPLKRRLDPDDARKIMLCVYYEENQLSMILACFNVFCAFVEIRDQMDYLFVKVSTVIIIQRLG